MRWRAFGVVVVLAAGGPLLVLPTTVVRAADTDVEASGLTYDPDVVAINQGDTVTWTNVDTDTPHSVTSNDDGAAFDSSPDCSPEDTDPCLHADDEYAFTFSAPGTFGYHCRVHGSDMNGVVIVAPLPTTTPTTAATTTTPPTTAATTSTTTASTTSSSSTSSSTSTSSSSTSTSSSSTSTTAPLSTTTTDDVTIGDDGGGGGSGGAVLLLAAIVVVLGAIAAVGVYLYRTVAPAYDYGPEDYGPEDDEYPPDPY